jgi:hypothetical protein
VDRALLEGDDPQALALDPADDLPGQAAYDAIRLDEDKGAFDCWFISWHGRRAYRPR